jgi:hypothetical protein
MICSGDWQSGITLHYSSPAAAMRIRIERMDERTPMPLIGLSVTNHDQISVEAVHELESYELW